MHSRNVCQTEECIVLASGANTSNISHLGTKHFMWQERNLGHDNSPGSMKDQTDGHAPGGRAGGWERGSGSGEWGSGDGSGGKRSLEQIFGDHPGRREQGSAGAPAGHVEQEQAWTAAQRQQQESAPLCPREVGRGNPNLARGGTGDR
ncbi:hypothetical protein EYF80_028103 [Liparis tanakae]|uniref:Uncharacterized protein n=1 Tax=Liparis tanakae TaxID=230148 RepID=A0A4Z2H9F0_9TELE|nr:hypothetical protein EYF80_028103 [Liparis tanakae]